MAQTSLLIDKLVSFFSRLVLKDATGFSPRSMQYNSNLSKSDIDELFELLDKLSFDSQFPSAPISVFCYSNLNRISQIVPGISDKVLNMYFSAILNSYAKCFQFQEPDANLLKTLELFYVLNYAIVYIRLYLSDWQRLFYKLYALCFACFDYSSLQLGI